METAHPFYFRISVRVNCATFEVTAAHDRPDLTLAEAIEACDAALPPYWSKPGPGGWVTLRFRPCQAPVAAQPETVALPVSKSPRLPVSPSPNLPVSQSPGLPEEGHCPGCGRWKQISARVGETIRQCQTCHAIDDGLNQRGTAAP